MQGSRSTWQRVTRIVTAAGLVAALAATALAQDYTATTTTASGDAYESPPSGATTLTALSNQDDARTGVTLPFSFPYYGSSYNSVSVCTNGFIQFGGGTATNYSNLTLPQSGSLDGIVCPYWDDLYLRTSGLIKTWTAGSAPNRRFIISWEAVPHISSSTSAHTFQIKLFETSGDVVFAYTNTGSYYLSGGYTCGIDEYGGSRYVYAPGRSGSGNTSAPVNFRFEPDVTTFSGRLMIDEVVSDATGYGQRALTTTPAAGMLVEIRAGGKTAGSGYTDADGYFAAEGIALNSTQTGTLTLVSGSTAALVTPSTSNGPGEQMSAPFSRDIVSSISFGGDNSVGTYTLGDLNDSGAATRAPMQIALVMDRIRAQVTAITGTTIPRVDVFYDPNSALPSRYTPPGTDTPASIRISGAAASNPDALDPAVIARLYARHVLTTLTGTAPTSFTQSLDVSTSAEEAFADGLGLYAYAAVTGETIAFDGTGSSSATSLDLESPTLTRAAGPTVAGWAAAALFDLLDGANESWDFVDGQAGDNAARVVAAVDAISGAATPAAFLDSWVNLGYPGPELVTDLIHHGLLPDDVNEPNDTLAQAQSLGVAGLRATGKTLNRLNQDWYRFTLQQPAPVFFVEMVYDRYLTAAVVDMRVFRADGTLISVGAPEGDNGPIKSTLTNLTAGDYLVQLTHISGATITSYEMQIYAQMSLALASAPAWTVGKRIQQPLDLFGGIPPYTVLAKDAAGDPFTAIQFIPSQTSAPFDFVWTPKEVGVVTIQVVSTDSGSPTHSRTLNLAFVVNPELAFSAPELTGVALDKQADVNLGRIGGTDPITLHDQFGDLPGGLSITEDFHIQGTASEPGGGAFGFTATDVAGSEASVDSFLVVCVPIETKKQPVPLAAGQAAAGFYFDALTGSNVSMQLKTSKKRAKRDLNFLVIGPDGNVVQGGSAKIKAGSVSIKGLTAPTTGRYFMAFASDDGGAETELQGTLKLQLPKKAAGKFERMELGQPNAYEFGALAGATLDVKGKTTDGMEIRVLFIIQPDSTVVPFDDVAVTNNNGKVTIKTRPLSQSGTYTLVVAAQKTDLADFSFKVKLKQPSGTFSLDD